MSFSNVSPSHRLQFSINCSSVGPSHGAQSFRNRLLQCGSPMGSQVLPANLLWRGLLCPRVHGTCQEPASVWAPHRVVASFGHPPALVWGPFHGLQVDISSTVDLHRLQQDSLPHHGLHHGLQGTLCSGVSHASSPSFFTGLGVCRVASDIFSLLSWLLFCSSFFSTFLNMLSRRPYRC